MPANMPPNPPSAKANVEALRAVGLSGEISGGEAGFALRFVVNRAHPEGSSQGPSPDRSDVITIGHM
ncbi:hypothetical protein ACQP1K_07440 [Sphaerimonospora sp. CA-214678]|uniref:hypothetical protein n=1 Tax=Sphaerimonospora sp. CA-214678 TaxID=3240029 RepID=UPI003D8F4FC6